MKQNADYYFQRAKGRTLTLQDLKVGVSELNQAIQLDPENIEYLLLRGDYLYRLDEYQLAIDDFTKVIELSQEIENLNIAYSKRAICHGEVGKKHELLKDLDWLIEHGVGTATDYSWRAFTRTKLGYLQDAISDYNLLCQMEPENETHLLQRAHAFYDASRYDEALNDLTQILSFKKQFAPSYLATVYHWRGRTYYKLDRLSEALDDFNEAMRLDGKDTFSNIADCINMLKIDD